MRGLVYNVAFVCLRLAFAVVATAAEWAGGRRVALFGAMERHNFGDVLMPHVIGAMLTGSCGVPDHAYIYCGIYPANMTRYGGHNVVSISDLIKTNLGSSRVDVILTGGEVCRTSVRSAFRMLPGLPFTPSRYHGYLNSIGASRLLSGKMPAYILDREAFESERPNAPHGTVVANAMGGIPKANVQAHLSTYDFVTTRNRVAWSGRPHPMVPDTVVTLRCLFGERIARVREERTPYIAVQLKADVSGRRGSELAAALVAVARSTSLAVVFFRAGAAPGHDSLENYEAMAAQMRLSAPDVHVEVSQELDIFKICSVIANARFVLATSMHVRIVAFSFSVPRFTLQPAFKHTAFIESVDYKVHKASTITTQHVAPFVLSTLSLETTMQAFRDQRNARTAVDKYYKTFLEWANLIAGPGSCKRSIQCDGLWNTK